MREKVEKVLEEIRPMLLADGGDIQLVGIEGGVVKVKLQGACHGCPGAAMTLAYGIEMAIKDKVPEVVRVEAV